MEGVESKDPPKELNKRTTVLEKKVITEEFLGSPSERAESSEPGADYAMDSDFLAARKKPRRCKQRKRIRKMRKQVSH